MIEILPLTSEHISASAALFVRHYQDLRQRVPVMPADMADTGRVTSRLEWILNNGGGLAALQDGRLVGYLTWLVDEGFRGTTKTAAYCPEWGHAVVDEAGEKIYRLLYIEATRRWTEAGYSLYALTYLVNNHNLEPFLYHNGFGMIVMDAVRPIEFEAGEMDPGLTVRKCSLKDVDLIAAIDREHWGYYAQPPTLMTPRQSEGTEMVCEFMQGKHNAYWLAEVEGRSAGFIRFEYGATNASVVVRSEKTITITGAYMRPVFRGRGAATAILQTALAEYAGCGFVTCTVDFESINPQAYLFWRKYFQVVCHSVMRCPEKYL
jgi:GNAT superfamily N-acetyltransferase